MSFVERYLPFLIFLLITMPSLSGCGTPTSIQNNSPLRTPDVSASPQTPTAHLEVAQSDFGRELNPQVSPDDLSSLTGGNSEFAFDLYQVLREQSGNLFFSPLSISSALAMVYAGARNETERQMAQTLHFTLPQEQLHPAFNALTLALDQPDGGDIEEDTFQLELANSLWGQEGFEYQTTYLDLIAANYGAGLQSVDFVAEDQRELARTAINQWVSNHTAGKIEDIIPEGILTDLTRLVLVNAIYFNAKWETPFLGGTVGNDFTRLDGRHKSVPTMSRRAHTPYVEGSRYQAVELPYRGDSTAMIVILPEQGYFEAIEKIWALDLIEEIDQSLVSTDVKLYMPRFAFDSKFNLGQIMAELGMPDAFDAEAADFTGITVHARPRLFLKHVLHQAIVSVDEMGTEAAASTAAIEEIASEPIVVRIDRPFLFFIYDRESDTILFVGRVLDPTE